MSLPRQVDAIALPGVAGRIDHLSLDAATGRLFVAALGSGTVEVVDLARHRRAERIAGFEEPQGVVFAAGVEKLFVADGRAAVVRAFQGGDLAPVGRTALRDDPDNVRAEPGTQRVWVGEGGDRTGALAALDARTGALTAEVALDAHPESFQLDPSGPRIFVNVPRHHEVEVVDRDRRVVVARWSLPCRANFPMALDPAHGRLLVGCRRPPKLVALDVETGETAVEVDAPADVDDVFVDPAQGRVYVSAGEGVVRVYALRGPDRLEAVGDLPTRPGARTSLLVADLQRLFVAAPARGADPATILVFATGEPPIPSPEPPPE